MAGNGCMFGIHIYKGSFVISIVGLLFSLFIVGWCLFFHSFVFLIIGGLSFFSYLSVIIGNHIEESFFFWPFFIFMPLVLISEAIFFFYSFLVHGAVMSLDTKEIEADHDMRVMIQSFTTYFFEVSQLALIFGFIMIFAAFLQIYFYAVIRKAYIYLLKVRNYPPPLNVGWSHRV